MTALYYATIIRQRQLLRRLRLSQRIRRIAFDRLRGQHSWRNGVHAFDKTTGITIVFARGVGGNVLELRVPPQDPSGLQKVDLTSLAVKPAAPLHAILVALYKTSPTMELREYDYVTDTAGELISGPPPKS